MKNNIQLILPLAIFVTSGTTMAQAAEILDTQQFLSPLAVQTNITTPPKIKTPLVKPASNHNLINEIQLEAKRQHHQTLAKLSAVAGQLDPNFSHPIFDLGGTEDVQAVEVQGDGKIVVAGFRKTSTSRIPFVLRLNSDGSADTSFNSGALVLLNQIDLEQGGSVKLTIQNDGKIVVGAWLQPVMASEPSKNIIYRLTSSGNMDNSFSSDGYRVFNFEAANLVEKLAGLAVTSNNQIIYTYNSTNYVKVVKLTHSGGVDTSFGSNGVGSKYISGSNWISSRNMTLSATDKILVTGMKVGNTPGSSADIFVTQFTSNGSIDYGFGTSGLVLWDFGSTDSGSDIKTQADGKVVLAGNYYDTTPGYNVHWSFVMRMHSNGSLDTSFNGSGYNSFALALNDSFSNSSVEINQDGKIKVGSLRIGNSGRSYVINSYNTDGTLDTSYGNVYGQSGFVEIQSTDFADMTLQADDKLVVASSYQSNNVLTTRHLN